MTDNFRKVYCDLCEQKIYLNDFPENWDELSSDEQYAYLNDQCRCDNPNVEAFASLSGWREKSDVSNDVADWVLICRRCGDCE